MFPNINPAWHPSVTPSQTPMTTDNQYLKPVADLEATAEGLTHAAHVLADIAMGTHASYDAAQSAIKPAVGAWHAVGKAADALDAIPVPADPALAALLAQAKLAAPGIRASVLGALHDLGDLHKALLADAAVKRPDLPPAKAIDPYVDPGTSLWVPLAIVAGIGYLLWKAVF